MNHKSPSLKNAARALFVVFATTVLLLLLVGPSAAAATRVPFEGLGTSCEPPQFPELPWLSGDRVLHVRNMVQVGELVTNDPRFTGAGTLTINGNLKFTEQGILYGPTWGSELFVVDGGYWEGSWTGKIEENGDMSQRGFYPGHGAYEGLQAVVLVERDGPPPPEGCSVVNVSGEILETGAYRP